MPKRLRQTSQSSRRVRPKLSRRSRVSVSRSLRPSPALYHFKRTVRLPQITFQVATSLMYGEEFNIGMLPNSSEFSALFDCYRINGIKMEWVPTLTGSDANPNSTTIFLPNLLSVIDTTDSSAPSGINELMQYSNCRRTKVNRTHKRYFKPKVAGDTVGTAGATGYESKSPGWYSFGVNVAHYGVKWGLDQIYNAATGGFGMDRYVTIYFSCKNVR